jgi:hypothetical protein
VTYFFDRAAKVPSNDWCHATSAAVFIIIVVVCHPGMAAITFTPFGSNGQGGTVNSQFLFFGSGGDIFELDAFLNIAGSDLNGGTAGTSAQLSQNALPAGVGFQCASSLSASQSDLSLSYTFSNNTGSTLAGLWFGFFVDAQIDEPTNGYVNEAAGEFGTLGSGAGDISPDAWEADEPGYVSGNVFQHLLDGVLDDANAAPAETPNDVSLALGFQLGTLTPGHQLIVQVLLSDAGSSIGGFALQHFDMDPDSFATLTVSGVAVPEPSSVVLAGLAFVGVSVFCRARRVQQSRQP